MTARPISASKKSSDGFRTSRVYTILRFVARWIPPSVLRVKAVYLQVLPRERWQPAEDCEGLRWAREDDIEGLEDLSFRPPGVEARLARGGRAVIVKDGDQILGCMWFEPTAPLYEQWLRFVLRDSDMWISDIYVAPSHRGRALANRLGHWGRNHLPADVTAVVGVSNALNKGPRRAGQKSGYDIFRISYARLLGFAVVKLPGRLRFGWTGHRRPFVVSVAEVTRVRQAV